MATIDNNPRKNIPHYSIFEYWKDKVILENGDVKTVDDVWNKLSLDKYIRVVYDWGEPCCWACDKTIMSTYEENEEDLNIVGFGKIWNDRCVKSHLQRCHIVPRTLGGADSPENLFLLCNDCHEKSPDTINKKSFFRWVFDQRKTHFFGTYKPHIVLEKVREILSRRGMDELLTDVAKCLTDVEKASESFGEYMRKHSETHEFRYSETTLFEGYVDWLLHNYLDKCLG